MPEEQARAIVAQIVNFPPGGGPPSGQTPETPQRARHIQGSRGRGGRGRRGGRGGGYREGRERGDAGGRIRRLPPLKIRPTRGRPQMRSDGDRGGQWGIVDTLTASSWGTQESGAGGLQGGRAGRREQLQERPSAAADKAGTRGRHGARQGHRGKTEADGKMWDQ